MNLPPHCPRRPRFSAFTLIELLAVISIMIIIGSLAAPTVATMLRGKMLTRATDGVSGIIDQARVEAMSKDTYVWLGFQNVMVTDSGGKNKVKWQLQVAVMRSLNGTLSMSASNLRPAGDTAKFDSVVMTGQTNIKGNAASKLLKALPPAAVPVQVNDPKGACYSMTNNFTLNGIKFDQIITITPEGEAIAGVPTSVNNGFDNLFLVGLRRVVGIGDGTKPDSAFLPDATDMDQAAILFSGGTMHTQIFRP